jgi:hypothetical protein
MVSEWEISISPTSMYVRKSWGIVRSIRRWHLRKCEARLSPFQHFLLRGFTNFPPL